MHPHILRLFDDPLVTDAAVGPQGASVRAGGTWVAAGGLQFELAEFLVELAEAAGVRLDYANPLATIVVEGFRVHAVLGFGVTDGPSATFRRIGAGGRLFECVEPETLRRYFLIERLMLGRQNVLVAGPAGAGKTTLLRTLLGRFDGERVITIEDAPELQLESPNSVALLARGGNTEGAGAISLDNLVAESLRMSPDRIAVGEIRGGELLVLADALNTGHSGAGATIHANSLAAVPARLQSIGARLGLSQRAVALLLSNAIQVVAFVDRGHRITGVGRLSAVGDELVVCDVE